MTTESIAQPDDLTAIIATQLNEPNTKLIRQIIEASGPEQAQTHLAATLEIEAGGMMTADGSRRRTPGGVFFLLAKKGHAGQFTP